MHRHVNAQNQPRRAPPRFTALEPRAADLLAGFGGNVPANERAVATQSRSCRLVRSPPLSMNTNPFNGRPVKVHRPRGGRRSSSCARSGSRRGSSSSFNTCCRESGNRGRQTSFSPRNLRPGNELPGRGRRETRRRPCGAGAAIQACFVNSHRPIPAPCGSLMIAKRPIGSAVTSLQIFAPSAFALATAAERSGTVT